MRWKTITIVLVALHAFIAGCKQQCFLTEADYNHYTHELDLPPNLESPRATVLPSGLVTPVPSTANAPQCPRRYLTLNEAIATAIERGRTGIQNNRLLGTFEDTLPSFAGSNINQGESQSDSVRVLALEPAFAGSNIESALSRFDVQWNTSMLWQRTDQPLGGNFLDNFTNGDSATFSSSLLKPLPTGGVAGITFSTQYTFLTTPPAGITNPAYRPNLQFAFEQPLLQGFGVEINQLRQTHPGSVLTPFPTSTHANEGILITRLQFDVQRAAFETQLSYLVLNTEIAYWNLYGSYWTLYAREQALRQALEAWDFNKARYAAGQVSSPDLAQTRQQYELFRGQRVQALDQILENERQLRGLMGLPVEDGWRLVPVDQPTLVPYQPDWSSAVDDALTLRPELFELRQLVKFRQLDLIRQQNLLLPDLRFTSTYDTNGLGSQLDGGPSNPNNAFSSLASNDFHDWSFGLRLNVPLGFRDAHAGVRQARLRLSQSYMVLRDEEDRARSFLAQQYRLLGSFYTQIQALRAQREAAAVQLEARFGEYQAGKIILDVLQTAQQAWAAALSDEYNAIVQYNNSQARFEFARGTLLRHDNVVIAEGPLPRCAQVRAVEHERQRSEAIVLRERARPGAQTDCPAPGSSLARLPELPLSAVPAVPAVAAVPVAPVPVEGLLIFPRKLDTPPAGAKPPPTTASPRVSQKIPTPAKPPAGPPPSARQPGGYSSRTTCPAKPGWLPPSVPSNPSALQPVAYNFVSGLAQPPAAGTSDPGVPKPGPADLSNRAQMWEKLMAHPSRPETVLIVDGSLVELHGDKQGWLQLSKEAGR